MPWLSSIRPCTINITDSPQIIVVALSLGRAPKITEMTSPIHHEVGKCTMGRSGAAMQSAGLLVNESLRKLDVVFSRAETRDTLSVPWRLHSRMHIRFELHTG